MAVSGELGDVSENIVEELIKQGRFNSRSEVLREGVRLVQQRELKLILLDKALAKGISDVDAGRVKPAGEVFAALKTRFVVTKAS